MRISIHYSLPGIVLRDVFLMILCTTSLIAWAQDGSKNFATIAEISFSRGTGNVSVSGHEVTNKFSSGSFKLVFGKNIKDHLFLGGGFGVDGYPSYSLFPLTCESRLSLLNGTVHPLINLFGGYAFPFMSGEGGPTFGSAIGVSKDQKHSSIFITIGVKWQRATATYHDSTNSNGVSATVYYTFFSTSVGVKF